MMKGRSAEQRTFCSENFQSQVAVGGPCIAMLVDKIAIGAIKFQKPSGVR